MKLSRLLKHLWHPPWLVRNKFPPSTLNEIETRIKLSESKHRAEIRFAVESSMGFFELLHDISCFEHGLDVFSELRIWDTAENNGVLIFLLLADKKVEIIADRGLNEKVEKAEWQHICQLMERHFKKNEFETGVIKGIEKITLILAKLYPVQGQKNINELSNKPLIL